MFDLNNNMADSHPSRTINNHHSTATTRRSRISMARFNSRTISRHHNALTTRLTKPKQKQCSFSAELLWFLYQNFNQPLLKYNNYGNSPQQNNNDPPPQQPYNQPPPQQNYRYALNKSTSVHFPSKIAISLLHNITTITLPS